MKASSQQNVHAHGTLQRHFYLKNKFWIKEIATFLQPTGVETLTQDDLTHPPITHGNFNPTKRTNVTPDD